MEGVIAVLKPPGLTSSDVVTDIRRICGIKRIGHAGTLDPGAAGVLLICVGRATRLFDYIVDRNKTYLAEITFGAETDTQDSYGKVIEKSEKVVTPDMLKTVLKDFEGEIEQVVPIYSAANQNGVKLYKLARAGKPIDEKRRKVTILSLDYISQIGENRFLIKICCTKGTYIRTLCSDIGRALGAFAHMSFLLRTASGNIDLNSTYSIEELRTLSEQGRLFEAIIPCEDALSHLKKVNVGDDQKTRTRLLNGLMHRCRCGDSEAVRVYCGDEFIGIGAIRHSELKLKLTLCGVRDE